MRVAIIGASGRSGQLVAAEVQRRGHRAVGVVRNPAKAVGIGLDETIAADATDGVGLARALAGVDAVISCVGPVKGESITVMQDAVAPLLVAMTEVAVRRLVVVTATGWLVDGDDPLSRFVAKPLLGVVLRDGNADFAATETRIRAGDRDWTIVRPPMLTNGPARGRYRSRRNGNVRWGYSISRADLASAVVDVLEDPSAIGRVVAVSG